MTPDPMEFNQTGDIGLPYIRFSRAEMVIQAAARGDGVNHVFLKCMIDCIYAGPILKLSKQRHYRISDGVPCVNRTARGAHVFEGHVPLA